MLGRDDDALWSHLAADPEWVLDVTDEYLDVGLYQDAVALLDRKYPAVGELQTEPGAVLPQDYPLVSYYRGYARQRLGQSPAEDFRAAAVQSTLYVHPYRASSYAVLRAAVEQNPADGTAHYLLGCLLFSSRATDQALAEWKLAKGSGARLPAFYETVSRVLIGVKHDDRQAESLLEEGLAVQPGDAALTGLLASIRNGSAAGGGGPLPSQQVFNSPMDAADYALTMLANGNLAGARAVFETKSLRDAEQPPAVRQAYAEVSLQSLLASARPGSCEDVAAGIHNFAADVAKQLRMQFYVGLAEWLCGGRKPAESRWTAIAKSKVPASAIDFAFPVLAASLIDPAGSQRVVETALEAVRSGGGPPDKGLRLYVEGMLLRAAGREGEAMAKFKEGAAATSIYTRYLNAAAQSDPPLPR
jgi:tetratricopeptide (TPR) repeat protein